MVWLTRSSLHQARLGPKVSAMELHTSRLTLRGLRANDFPQWSEVRLRCADWLRVWEPRRSAGAPDPARDPIALASRCSARERERQLGTGYAFGVFHRQQFVGEVNVSNIRRGPFQSADIGYWVDEQCAGKGFTPEAVVGVFSYVFDHAHLHRAEIAIIPRNQRSLRVVEKLGIRCEGVALQFLEIDGVWEDHARFAILRDEWNERREELMAYQSS